MTQGSRHSTQLLECVRCGRIYQRIKYAMKTCGARIGGVTCGGALKPVEKKETPK
jgi:hypothetical protein